MLRIVATLSKANNAVGALARTSWGWRRPSLTRRARYDLMASSVLAIIRPHSSSAVSGRRITSGKCRRSRQSGKVVCGARSCGVWYMGCPDGG
jgi:hypothetical protein